MTLKELKIGQSALIKAVGGTGALRQHFLDMGVIPGAEVTVVKFAPMGDPMELQIHGYELSLRLDEAEKILVELIDERTRKHESAENINNTVHPGLGEDGNDVDSKEVFKNNKFTVVNYWFTGCTGCVAELADLEKLNKEYKEMGGELVGVNTTLLDGKEEDIKEAKDLLAAKGVTYRNFYFAKDSAAGKFTENIFAYPITYVIDSQGNIVGEPILGALMEDAQKELLDKYIQEALSK